MLKFLGDILEQLDLADEHLGLSDPNNARFALMLTDNAVELTFHKIATDTQLELQHLAYKREQFRHHAALGRAISKHFEPKVKLVELLGIIPPEVAHSIVVLHRRRNEVYHLGVQHQAILLILARYYFHLACAFLAIWRPAHFYWSSNQVLPERAKKYFSGPSSFPGKLDHFHLACRDFAAAHESVRLMLPEALSDHMLEIVEMTDTDLDIVSNDAPQKSTRDDAIVSCQAWAVAFSEKGREIATERGAGELSVWKYVDWFKSNYEFAFRSDPIPGWRKRAEDLRHADSPHKALKVYFDFLEQTEEVRQALRENAMAVERHIDDQIERMRGN